MKNVLLKSTRKASLVRNGVVTICWWIVFFPGFYSADSFAVVNMARNGNLSDDYSAPWAIFVNIFSVHGRFPGIVTLIFGAILALSVTNFVFEIMSEQTSAIASFLICFTPLVGAMGITLWHDIPMTSGFFMITTFLIRSAKSLGSPKRNTVLYLFPGALLITFRLNGIPTLVVVGVLLSFVPFMKHVRKYLLLSVVVALVFSFTTSQFVKPSSITSLPVGWMAQDISCYASTSQGQGFVERVIPGIGTTETWQSASWCGWFSTAKLTYVEMLQSPAKLVVGWSKLAVEDPGFILRTHSKRHKYLVPIPIYGLPHPPFLQSNIESQNQGVEWAFPALASKARNFVRIWNYASPLFAYSGMWLLFLFIFWLKSQRRDVFLIALFASVLTLSLFIVAEISDGRYALFTLISWQVLAVGLIIDWLLKGTSRR